MDPWMTGPNCPLKQNRPMWYNLITNTMAKIPNRQSNKIYLGKYKTKERF